MIATPSGPIALARGRHGLFAVNEHDQYVGRSLLLYGEFSEPEVELLATLPRRDVLVEVGANIGALTVPLSRHFGMVVAVEPQRLVWQILVANLALNDRRNVRVMHAGCGATTGALRVPMLAWEVGNNFGGLSLADVPTDAPCEAVPCYMLDEMRVRPDVLKLDCEGMELDVLKGAERLLAPEFPRSPHPRPILYVENDRAEKSAALVRWLCEAASYRLWWHRPPLYSPTNAAGVGANVFGMIASHNMLCVPAESEWTPDVERFGLTPVED